MEDELPDEWAALHSLGLPGHETKIWGEADIVLLSTLGIFVLEVKGGTVSCTDGIWRFNGPDFDSYTKKEDPWTQAKTGLMVIRRRLQDANQGFKSVLFGYGVIMPFTSFTTRGIEIVPEVLLDKRDINQSLSIYINKLHKYWEQTLLAKHGRAYRSLSVEEVQKARQILRPDLETALSIGSYLSGISSHLLYLTNEQIRTSRRIASNPRTLVSGPAGTGKSILAYDRALELSKAGHKVLFLCFNELLARHVSTSAADDARAVDLTVCHAHGLYSEVIRRGGLSSDLQKLDPEAPDFFSKSFPDLAALALCDGGGGAYDCLVVDEAQDLLTTAHLDVLELLVRGGLNGGNWHLFFDPQQNLYSSAVQKEVETRLKEAHPTFDTLSENCRNTKQIAVQTSIISGIDVPIAAAVDGPNCELTYYSDRADALAKIETLVADLVSADVRTENLVILSTRKLENSLLAGLSSLSGRGLFDARLPGRPPPGSILFSTMHAFKGLERDVVLAIDMQEIGKPRWSTVHYVGLSRARCLLHTFLPESARPAYARQAAKFGARVPGITSA
jgi:hypothetical protein